MKQHNKIKAIISGGGTGGHIFPAISIANELMKRNPETEILFVGALGRMEMERVPAAGYRIEGLPVSGFQRRLTLKNISVVINLFKSLKIADNILNDFKPQIVIGVGGYASGPLLRRASRKGIPTLLQEQNSYAGVTNKLLAKKAERICVAYKDMEKYFPPEKIVLTGNPVRDIRISENLRSEGLTHFGFNAQKPVLVVMGGSLGARTINMAMLKNITEICGSGIQVLWQTGKYYFDDIRNKLADIKIPELKVTDFITRMDLAHNIADLLVSRAGAISISEICLTGRAAILVPSPNVAEDHQTKNAMALVRESAAIMVRDNEAENHLKEKIQELIHDKEKLSDLKFNSLKMAKPDATSHIVDEIYNILGFKE